ncbi:MAG: two-component system, NarL family, sensor histidine kinase UhpB [Solirubrobacteraceae bacterium]|jgi:two-component system sensor histidine kinase UhpB|nr:two-component system, NarL family, sensor histidine kinase UhpB [Solirubrobacteraceae bacterium]
MMRRRSLLAQVLAVNLLLIAGTVLLAAVAVDFHFGNFTSGRELGVLALALIATLLGNALLLRRRFAPLEQMLSTMEHADLADSAGRVPTEGADSREVQRLGTTLNRMLGRLEIERREAGKAAVRAQERERQRIAQDLHDEVNQALTAVLLRLEATIHSAPAELRRELEETKRLATQAMEELLNLARQLRPSVLDDHGLIAALQTQVRDFSEQTRIRAEFRRRGPIPRLTSEQQLSLYRVTQESLSNVAQHAAATRVEVELSFVGRTVLRISDDGSGFSGGRDGGLGLSGMRERALVAGGTLDIYSAGPGRGTRVELKIG